MNINYYDLLIIFSNLYQLLFIFKPFIYYILITLASYNQYEKIIFEKISFKNWIKINKAFFY